LNNDVRVNYNKIFNLLRTGTVVVEMPSTRRYYSRKKWLILHDLYHFKGRIVAPMFWSDMPNLLAPEILQSSSSRIVTAVY
jgi:hypothetical protein